MRHIFCPLLLLSCLSVGLANRVYVHPFNLFASENVSCETIKTEVTKPLETVPLTPLNNDSVVPDTRDFTSTDRLKQNVTQRTAVLAELLNSLGLRMYKALSSKQKDSNTLLSPMNTFGSLVTLYLGASKKTAIPYQQLLGLNRDTDRDDCVSLVDGHNVLRTLQDINSLVDGPKDEINTCVWAFARKGADLSKDFVQGTQDFSDASYIRAVDFSQPQEAETQINNFIQKTSDRKITSLFKDLSSTTDLLFVSSVHFKGNWKKAFQTEKTTMQEFKVDATTTVMVPLMTHTGTYKYLNDKDRKCTVVKLSLSKRAYMLLVLPHEGSSLHDMESRLQSDIISGWHRHLKEGFLELSLPKFSMTALTDLRSLLFDMAAEIEKSLLGSDAEFERLSSKKPFSVDKVFNKVMFEMSEGGSETQDKTQDEGVPLKFTVNRPFFFAIVEGNSNAILMLGKIRNPTL
ncbi:angiotensinogen [Oncorhynchus clarkii lewisi]|uniref:angiotensinogen n=1 Tax=Oncorhynchus clarkii lewisi TaxID=490388 RepID=UPI0039B8B49F